MSKPIRDLVSLETLIESAVGFSLPLKVPFRGVTHREGLVFNGPSGWGEFSPFLEYDLESSSHWLASGVEAAFGSWPDSLRDEVRVNAIIPALDPIEAAALAVQSAQDFGSTTFKIKVAGPGSTLDDDCARLDAVREALDAEVGRHARIRIDANGAWDFRQAIEAIAALDDASGGLEYVEQPCMDLVELSQVRRNCAVMIAVDESIRNAEDPVKIANGSVADVLVLKVPPLGGVSKALEVIEAARVPVVVSGAIDTAVGLSAGLALAGAIDELPFACGLGTGGLLGSDLVASTRVPVNGVLKVDRVEPDEDQLAAASESLGAERMQWWIDRLTKSWELV